MIYKRGLHPTTEKVNAIQKAIQKSKKVADLDHFWALSIVIVVLPNLADQLTPLMRLITQAVNDPGLLNKIYHLR